MVECKITDIHSVTRHQRLVQAVEHKASELCGSVDCNCGSDPGVANVNDPVYRLP